MADHPPRYPPDCDSPSTLTLAMRSATPISPIKRARSTKSEDGRRQRPRYELQTTNNLGISGNARVVNIGGDYIMHNTDDVGAETHAVLESIEQRLKVVHDKELDKEVYGWLAAPDVSQNLNAAIRKRQAGTGDWFLDGAEFAEWKENARLLLCIYGTPGCGKTILCSTIVEAVKDLCKTRLLSGWAYFLFDSRNANKGLQLYENLLRSILSQLCSRSGGIPEAVQVTYQAHGNGKEHPSVRALEKTLRQVIQAFDDVYIMVDSLDESGDRSELVRWIQTIAGWNSARWHLLTTSRSEPDITSHLERIPNMRNVYLKSTVLEKDIGSFLDARLSRITRWSEPIRALIKTTLMGGVDGMFRWAAMQMDSLEHCLHVRAVRERLKTLPRDLEATYEQILVSSPHQQDLLHMLHWLSFSARALQLEEIAEVASVDFDAADGPCYDPDLKYSNPSIALTVCSGLVTVTDGVVKLAHFSVKEYLISDRIKTGTAAHFAINLRLSHSVIAQTCTAYLLIFNQSDSLELAGGMSRPFPLHSYAAENLTAHLRLMENKQCPALQELLLKLFIPTPPYKCALGNWVWTQDFNERDWVEDYRQDGRITPPLYYASFLGLRDVVERLIKNNHNVDCEGGWFDGALTAAAANAHTETVKLLLESGTHINNHGMLGKTALLVAAERGHSDIIEVLLKHIEFRYLGLFDGQAAISGDTETTQLRFRLNTDPNFQGNVYGNTLQAAASKGHTKVVALLLEHGTDVNKHGGHYGTALQAAASKEHTDVVALLLEHGADVNTQGWPYGSALQAAAANGHPRTVKLLLENGADANIKGRRYGTALQQAASEGHTEVVALLLEHGAYVHIKGWQYGTALLAAARNGHTETAHMLLEHSAQ